MNRYNFFYVVLTSLGSLFGFHLPNCSNQEFFEVSSFNCRPCPYNGSMIASEDGLSCICDSHSVMTESGRCRVCNVTEIVSSDGNSCVPRRCQASVGRVVCRKCPKDYIAVTQNHDGSPMKEVQCVKCGRGYRPLADTCVKCDGCDCKRHEVVVHGSCLPKKYVTERPKYEENLMHPSYLLDIVKYEYLCVIYNISACRWLANACVSNFYSSDPAGACRLWIHANLINKTILPTLTANKTDSVRRNDEINLSNRQNTLLISAISYKNDGSFHHHLDPRKRIVPCFSPFSITIGEDYSLSCPVNITEILLNDELHALYVSSGGTRKPIQILIRKPNGEYVKKGLWYSNKFSKYFIFRRTLSATSNVTNLIYLQLLLIRLRIERTQHNAGGLKLYLNVEAHYAMKSPASDIFLTSLRVTNDLPSAGVIRGLEIWGSILCILMTFYALLQWRGVLRRGGHKLSLIPIMAGCISDAIYFATWTTLLHALAAEAGTLGLTLPLTQSEEQLTMAMIYLILTLKVIKVVYINWILCRYDIFFIDWSEYNPCFKDTMLYEQSNGKKQGILAREWIEEMHTKRRTSPTLTIILTLLTLHLVRPWQMILPKSEGYRWAIATIAWWSSYTVEFLSQFIRDRLLGSPPVKLQKTCTALEISMLMFQEELYAHYVHGRNDESSDTKYLSGPLSTCRVSCAPQFRVICKQLLVTEQRTLEKYENKQILLSKFLAAFFERALDGLSWVASERTTLETLLDVEIVIREGGNTSILLYETDNLTPSCFAITWWGNEWTLATFDSIVFSTVLFSTKEPLYAAFVTIALWQIIKYTITWLANRNVREKTNIKDL